MKRIGPRAWVALEFKPADLWVGAFYDVRPAIYVSIWGRVLADLHVWVCVVPCVPLHIVVSWVRERAKE